MWILDNNGSKCYNSEKIISIAKGITRKGGLYEFDVYHSIDVETIDDPANPVAIAEFENSETRDIWFETLLESIEKGQKFFWFDKELIKKGEN